MKYRSEFPPDARARVEAETLRAYAALEQDVRGMERWRREVPFIRCVMRVFIAFAREACEFGKKSNHRDWSDRELDQRCRDFLLSIVIDAWEDKAKDLGIREMFSSSGWGYSIKEDDRRKIEKSPEWKQYQELLRDAYEVQSARAADGSLPQRGPASATASETEASEPLQAATMSNATSSTQILPAETVPSRRTPQDFIDASRRQLRRSNEKFAAHIGISKDTLYAITKETRWVSDDNYILVAQACGCNPEDLHPRDIPRPEHRRR
jgi:DNA-binding XRE family transcriptional regulator